MKRIAKAVVIAVVIAAAGVSGIWWFLKVEENRPQNTLTLYGNIDIRNAQLAFIEAERIAKVMVEEGDRVKEGQVLATLDSDRLQAQIRQVDAEIAAQQQVVDKLVAGTRPQEISQARAEAAAARARMKNAAQNFARIQRTTGTGATTQQALDDARARFDVEQANLLVKEKALNLALEGPRKEDIAAARSRLDALTASLALLKVRLGDTTLKAPSAGIIQSRLLEPGEMAGPASPVFTLALTDPKWVRAYVPEPDLGLIQLGMRAVIQSDSFPNRNFAGWVGFISPEAEFTPKNVETTDLRTQLVYEARIFVRDSNNLLRLGMPVTVKIDRSAVALDPTGRNDAKKPPSEPAQNTP
ncbi:MAG: efflux RND transporter periplasmic adaptor subunit [Desulfobacterales bacterium]|nr:efflux RND transporter periplasmic adaptor subunit [Desulfobacterales bacterium]